MIRSIRSELYKALTNKMLYIAIAIGLAICALDVLENLSKIREFDARLVRSIASGVKLKTSHTGYSLFYLWMGVSPNTRGAALFCAVWPVLAAMAYGWSYTEERNSGVYLQIATRCGAVKSFAAKYAAVFVSGGLAVGVPMLADLLMNALVCPFDHIPPSFNKVRNTYALSELFYTSPWAYGLLWCGFVFLCGGVTACLCFIVGKKLRHGVMTVLLPYAIYVVWDAVINNLRMTVLRDTDLALSPLQLLPAAYGYANPGWLLFLILGTLTLISFGLGYWQVVKHELV